MRKVGLIGCGAINKIIAQSIEKRLIACDELVLYDLKSDKSEELKHSLDFPVTIANSLEDMLALRPTVIVEAASQQAVKDYIHLILNEKIELIVMSTGALLDLKLTSKKIHLPSGAIGGIDAISSAGLAGIDEIILTTRKSPEALSMKNNKAELVYEGSAEEAARRFPRGMNVAATLSLIVQPAKVEVKVISDPDTHRNTHEIQIKWKHGDMFLSFSNDPHPENPRTSALAAWAAVKLLKDVMGKAE